jgi:peroxiredoxin
MNWKIYYKMCEDILVPVFKNLKNIIIIALVVIILLLNLCSPSSKTPPEDTIITTVKTEYKTIEKTYTVYVPKWKTKIITEIDSILTPVDSAEILKDYFTKYSYIDTINIDTIGVLVVSDTIFNNKIASRQTYTNVKYPITTITNTIYTNKREFYAGVGVAGDPTQLSYAGLEVMYKNKKKQMYGLGVGVSQKLQPVFTGRLYWKIGK